MRSKSQMTADIVQHKAGDILGILQIALHKPVAVLDAKGFFQQILAFAVVLYVVFCVNDKVVPPCTLQILQRQAVALLTIF